MAWQYTLSITTKKYSNHNMTINNNTEKYKEKIVME